MVFCAKCGKKLNEGARFCPRCGTPAGEQGGAGRNPGAGNPSCRTGGDPSCRTGNEPSRIERPAYETGHHAYGTEQYASSTGNSVSQAEKGSSGAFSWNQAGQMRDLSREFQADDVEQNKLMAVLSYFSLLVLLPILCAKESRFARFHANQGLLLLLVSMGWQFISTMLNLVFDRYWWQFRFLLSLSGVGYLLILVLFCMGVANAVTGKAKELPLIGHVRILR